ncbi:MAG: glycosyltransferase family 2 protein [Malacoplasma sp.]
MISIILPTYKPEYYLYECFLSINNQTIDKGKFIVHIILNGSDTSYLIKIKNWLLDFDFHYKLTNCIESGVSLARNIGLELSESEFICFMDDDDIITPDYLEKLLLASDINTLGVSNVKAFSDNIFLQKDYFLTFNEAYNGIFSFKYKSNLSSIWGKLIHKKMIDNIRFNENIKLGEDSLFMFLVSKNINMIKSTEPDCLYLRRLRNNSAVTKNRNNLYYFGNFIYLIYEYTIAFLLDSRSYSLILYINRLMACFKSLILFIFKKHE